MLLSAKFLPSFLRNTNLSSYEMILVAIFVIYIISPVESPPAISGLVSSPLGLVVIFAITVFLFIYTNPILGILYLFVAYELLRRSDKVPSSAHDHSHGNFLPITMPLAAPKMPNMTPMLNTVKNESRVDVVPLTNSLEEETISASSPIGESRSSNYMETPFKPTAGSIHGASYA